MPIKLSIIEVDLGEDVPTIITEEIAELTQRNRDQLDAARAVAGQVQKVREDRQNSRGAVDDAAQTALLAAHARLLAAGPDGISAPEVLELVQPFITTSSAFTLRLKTYLRKQGNAHVLARKRVKGQDRYLLQEYNGDPPATAESPLADE